LNDNPIKLGEVHEARERWEFSVSCICKTRKGGATWEAYT